VYIMRKAFKSSEGMTKSERDSIKPSLLDENRNWQMIVWRFDRWLDGESKVPKKILDEWKKNIKRF